MSNVILGFIPKPLLVAIEKILPSRAITLNAEQVRKYKQIRASIEDIGLIEPLCVLALDRKSGAHILVDGHLRLKAMRDLGIPHAECLVAIDDEAHTYNSRVSHLSTIQEHVMIRRAIERGISPERLAKGLTIDVTTIIRQKNLLEGICDEVAALLKERKFSITLPSVLRQMKSTRQIECVELMISANNVTVSYARAMLATTSPDMLVKPKVVTARKNASEEQIAKMDREMASLAEHYRLAEQNYATDVLNLTMASKYVEKLLDNKGVMRHLQTHHPDVMDEFARIVEAVTLDG